MNDAVSLNYQGTSYQDHGDKDNDQVVVLVHGVGLSQEIWQPWVTHFASTYRVITYDFLGHGKSVNPDGARTLADFRDQAVTLIDHLNITRVHLVGFSLGALTAQSIACRNADRLDSLVLLHSVFNRSTEQLAAIEQRYQLTAEKGPMATVELAIKRWFSEQWINENPDYIEFIRTLFRNHRDDGYLKAYRVFCDADQELDTDTLSRIPCPSLAITGSLEPGSTPAMSQALAALLNGQCIINEGHLHMAPVEHAGLLITQVDRFIQSVIASGSN